MKLKYLLLSLTLFVTSVFIQDSKTNLISGKKWHAKAIQMGEQKMDVPPGEQNQMWMIFHKDGVHEVNANNSIKKGTWKFSKQKDSIHFITEKGKEKSMKLEKLTKESLVLGFMENGMEARVYLEKNK
ncbi:hypothetical protein [Pseudotenacibaculum haliotis]|uniref:Lipocalin-like domain-containing protein n=1 Tax=Pseudotenacibaculum haliotis TaxID=1862138 RepID=A0ABW5LTW5_9FLAO